MTIRTVLASTSLALLMCTQASAFDAGEFKDFSSATAMTSTWQNQSGSTMNIQIDSFGNVTGSYINRASGTGCQNSPYPIAGRVTGNFIAFSVGWNNSTQNCNSVTAWAGYAQPGNGGVQIVTNWNLAYQGSGGPGIQAGQDVFQSVATMETGSLLAK